MLLIAALSQPILVAAIHCQTSKMVAALTKEYLISVLGNKMFSKELVVGVELTPAHKLNSDANNLIRRLKYSLHYHFF